MLALQLSIFASQMVMIVVIFSLLTLIGSTEVDNLNILLPQLQQSPPTLPLQLISAQSGCYHWTSSLPQFISVIPHLSKQGDCSRQGLVSVAQVGAFSSSIYVTAKQAESESVLNIPVRIRKLNKINIASKSRMMNIREIQKLELFAYDSDGNTFTSLQGLRFEWKFEQNSKIIERVPLHHAQLYLPLRTRENLEKNGFQSDIIVVQALAPGNLKVTSRCIEPGYQSLYDQIIISVHQRFELKPGPIIKMAPESSLQLQLVRPNMEPILLPQNYYRLITCDGFTLNDTLFLTVPNKPSKCLLKVEDVRTKPPYESSVEIIVDYADQLRINTDPLVIVDRESEFKIQLLREGMVLLGENKNVKFSSDFKLDIVKKTLTASKKMTGLLSAQLGDLKKEIAINAFLQVSAIIPNQYLHLPVNEHFKLRLLGGTGVYDLQFQHDIAITSSLYVIHAKSVGQTVFTIKDRNHPINKAVISLKISQISQIHSLDAEKQVNRDEWGYFYVIGKSNAHETFTQCLQTSFSLHIPSFNVDIDKKVGYSEAVGFLHFHSSVLVKQTLQGSSLLKGKAYQIIDSYSNYVKYNQIDQQDLKSYVISLQNYGICKVIKFKSIVALQERATISVEGQEINTKVPLRVYNLISTNIQGENTNFVLTPESSLRWTYTGGSYSWPNSNTSAFVNGRINQGLMPTIVCPNKEEPSQSYQLKVQNKQTKYLLFPTSQTTVIHITCKFPKKLHLKLQHGEILDQLFIEQKRNVKGQVEAVDQSGQTFFNSSNVAYEFSSKTGLITKFQTEFNYKSHGLNDTLTIYTERLTSGLRFKTVSLQIEISVVSPIEIVHPLTPQDKSKNVTIVTLFTPKKPYLLNIRQMHSQVHIQCTKAVACEKGQEYIAVKLLKLGTGHVVVKDKRIYGSQEWHFEFIIVQLDEIKVTGNRDYMQVGQIISIKVTNYFNRKEISPYTYEPSYLQLVLHRNLRIIQQNANVFVVKAQQEGVFQIYGQNTYPKTIRSKQTFNLTVYKKIRTNIQETETSTSDNGILNIEGNTFILFGCSRTIRIQGGPKEVALKTMTNGVNILQNQINNRSLQILSRAEGNFQITITVTYKENIIAVIKVQITVSKVQYIQLQSIQQPVQGSHFRIHPKFKIRNSNIEESTCDFIYRWSISHDRVKLGQILSFGFIDGASINATAISSGIQVINLQVISKESGLTVGKISKYLQILREHQLSLPTLINFSTACQLTSLLMPPSSKYIFEEGFQAITQSGIISVGDKKNIIQSGKKIGHSTLSLKRSGYRPLNIEVEVKQIVGIFIENSQGYIHIQPHSSLIVPIHLQDNTGRLFVSPLGNLELMATSSNTDLIEVSLSPLGNSLVIKSQGQGLCIISVILPNKSASDSIVVSIGRAISPGRYIRVLPQAIVQFSSTVHKGKWISTNPQIASIQKQTGILQALSVGLTKIYYGQLSSTVEVKSIVRIEQIGPQRYEGISLSVLYKAFWNSEKGEQAINSLKSYDEINNNFNPICSTNSRYLTSKASIVNLNGSDVIECIVSTDSVQNWPTKITVTIKDASSLEIGQFNYQIKPHFKIQQHVYNLSPSNPQAILQIQTDSKINVKIRNGKIQWAESNYNQISKVQTIKINMNGLKNDQTWWLELECVGQKESVKVVFSVENKGQNQSFWSLSLDWPDYLIILMALVFGTICYVQYSNEQKFKLS